MGVISFIKRSRFVFPLACAAAVTMLVISESSYWESVRRLDELGALAQARTDIRELHIALLDAETGQRGYLLTGRGEYLTPYERGIASIDPTLRKLEAYYGSDPQVAALLAQMRALSDTSRIELANSIRLRDAGQDDPVALMATAVAGRQRMDAVRALGADLLARQSGQVVQGRVDLYRTLKRNRIGVALLSTLGLVAIYFFLRQNLVLGRHELALKRVVQADHDRLEIVVAERTAQLTELAKHFQTAREDERQRLARDLHDELGALLTSAKLDAARIKSRLAGTAPEALDRLADLVGKLDTGIALGRRIIEDLRPSTLAHLGLVATLEIQAREFAERSGLQVHCALEPVSLTPVAELVVYRVVQEAITNITKYAEARQVWLGLSEEDGEVEVTVRDNGVGFDTHARTSSAYGLLGMRFRVQAEGGSVAVVSAPGAGTSICARLPTAKASAA